jgi:excisionase family DNA binding protein
MTTEDGTPRSTALREALEKAKKGERAPTAMLSVTEACGQLGISRTTLYVLIRKKSITSMKIGSRRLISAKAIERFIEQLENEQAET